MRMPFLSLAQKSLVLDGHSTDVAAAAKAVASECLALTKVAEDKLCPVMDVAVKAYKGLGEVQQRIDAALERMDPTDADVKALEQLSLGVVRVREHLGGVIREIPEEIYERYVADLSADRNRREAELLLCLGNGGASCLDN